MDNIKLNQATTDPKKRAYHAFESTRAPADHAFESGSSRYGAPAGVVTAWTRRSQMGHHRREQHRDLIHVRDQLTMTAQCPVCGWLSVGLNQLLWLCRRCDGWSMRPLRCWNLSERIRSANGGINLKVFTAMRVRSFVVQSARIWNYFWDCFWDRMSGHCHLVGGLNGFNLSHRRWRLMRVPCCYRRLVLYGVLPLCLHRLHALSCVTEPERGRALDPQPCFTRSLCGRDALSRPARLRGDTVTIA